MEYFHDRGYLSVFWECGGTLAASAISSGVIHKVSFIFFIFHGRNLNKAPFVIG
jgi:riboflavin biosynthesis pyrimidine reductase